LLFVGLSTKNFNIALSYIAYKVKRACGSFIGMDILLILYILETTNTLSDMKQVEKTNSWLTGLLTGWGMRAVWAKVIAGAIIGALCATGILSLDSCSTSYRQSAAGDIEFTTTVVHPCNETK
jgi:hypothetical protein